MTITQLSISVLMTAIAAVGLQSAAADVAIIEGEINSVSEIDDPTIFLGAPLTAIFTYDPTTAVNLTPDNPYSGIYHLELTVSGSVGGVEYGFLDQYGVIHVGGVDAASSLYFFADGNAEPYMPYAELGIHFQDFIPPLFHGIGIPPSLYVEDVDSPNANFTFGIFTPRRDEEWGVAGLVRSLRIIPQGHDCNTNGVDDSVDIAMGTSQDCNINDTPDECDMASGAIPDCNGVGTPWDCPDHCHSGADCPNADTNCDNVAQGFDVAEIGSSANFGKQVCEAGNPRTDVNRDGRVNGLDLAVASSSACFGGFTDCNTNQIPDDCDIAVGTAQDIDGDGMPDSCPFLFEDQILLPTDGTTRSSCCNAPTLSTRFN